MLVCARSSGPRPEQATVAARSCVCALGRHVQRSDRPDRSPAGRHALRGRCASARRGSRKAKIRPANAAAGEIASATMLRPAMASAWAPGSRIRHPPGCGRDSASSRRGHVLQPSRYISTSGPGWRPLSAARDVRTRPRRTQARCAPDRWLSGTAVAVGERRGRRARAVFQLVPVPPCGWRIAVRVDQAARELVQDRGADASSRTGMS